MSALQKAWKDSGLKMTNVPAKSSLSEMRSKISYKFFEDIYLAELNSIKRNTFKGFYVYAIDGDQLDLPASQDVIENGFCGYPTSKNRETYYPKMYTVHSYDLVNHLITNFRYSSSVSETEQAQSMVKDFESNSISIYDRLYCGYLTMLSHFESKNYFIIRARTSGSGCNKEVMKFKSSKRRSENIIWRPSARYRVDAKSLNVRLVKVKNSRSNDDIIFITNVPEGKLTNEEISTLYQRRWGIESSFKDLTSTLKMNQFHSRKINGILQEIFALLWFVNGLKTKIKVLVKDKLLLSTYQKANFKLCAEIAISNIGLLLKRKLKEFDKELTFWILRSIETRIHLSRTYPRAVRLRGRSYALLNVVPKRQTERH